MVIYKIMVAYTEWRQVFNFAAEVAKKIRAKNPSMKYSAAVSQAWKTPEVIAAKKEYKAYAEKHKK